LKKYTEPKKTLSQQASLIFSEIKAGTLDFDFTQRFLKILSTLTKNDILTHIEKFFHPKNEFSIEFYSPSFLNASFKELEDDHVLEDNCLIFSNSTSLKNFLEAL